MGWKVGKVTNIPWPQPNREPPNSNSGSPTQETYNFRCQLPCFLSSQCSDKIPPEHNVDGTTRKFYSDPWTATRWRACEKDHEVWTQCTGMDVWDDVCRQRRPHLFAHSANVFLCGQAPMTALYTVASLCTPVYFASVPHHSDAMTLKRKGQKVSKVEGMITIRLLVDVTGTIKMAKFTRNETHTHGASTHQRRRNSIKSTIGKYKRFTSPDEPIRGGSFSIFFQNV